MKIRWVSGAFLVVAISACAVDDTAGPPQLGAPIPGYTAATLEGDSVSLSSLRGEVVLLNLWATWCAPCRKETPFLQELFEEHQEDGLHLVGVSLDTGAATELVENAGALSASELVCFRQACAEGVGAADLILVDDNFASIVAGVEEGRAAYDNIRKIVWMLISTAIAEVVLVALALVFDLPIPLTAVQILWLNLVTNGVQDIGLAFERREPDAMARAPRPPGQPIFDARMIGQCATSGLYAGALGFGLFAALLVQGWSEAEARNLTLLFMVFFENVHVLNCRSETRSLLRIPLRANPWVLAAVAAAQAIHVTAMYMPGVRGVLGVGPVTPAAWFMALGLAASVVAVAEAHKALIRRIDSRQGGPVPAAAG